MSHGAGTIIKGALLLTMAGEAVDPVVGDLRYDGGVITAIGHSLDPAGATVLDGRDRLVLPGLVNAHLHSGVEGLMRSRYENLPLEVWAFGPWPLLDATPIDLRLIYLRTMLVGLESVRSGVTTVHDDLDEWGGQTNESLTAVFAAYEELGLRASCSGNIANRHWVDTFPYAEEVMPADIRSAMRMNRLMDADECVAHWEEGIARFHGRAGGRLRYVIAPCAPQWCTDDMLVRAAELCRRHGINLHAHSNETKLQAIGARAFPSGSAIRHLHELGALDELTTIAHSIWVTDDEIELMAAARSSVVHVPLSNLKIGAGIAPLRQLLAAGVNVGLGTDGATTNDTARLFDTMRVAALLHCVASPDYASWPSAADIVRAATIGGARCACIESAVGSLEIGKRADLLVLDLRTLAFTPLNDVCRQLAYCENGSSIERVVVDGRTIVEHGRVLTVDEPALLDELRAALPAFQARHAELERRNARFTPALAALHRRASAEAAAVDRYSGG